MCYSKVDTSGLLLKSWNYLHTWDQSNLSEFQEKIRSDGLRKEDKQTL